MQPEVKHPEELVKTQAETVPAPDRAAGKSSRAGSSDPQLLREIKQLADRAGGLEKLQELVNALSRMEH